MPLPVAAGVVRLMQRALCGAIALGLSLLCAASAVAATSPMTAMSDTASHSVMGAMGELGATATASTPVAAVADGGPDRSGMCERLCVSKASTGQCALVVGLIVTSLLGLLLATRRDTFLGLLARLRTSARRLQPPQALTTGSALSLSSLCVLRI